MKSVGEILKKERLRQNLMISQIASLIKTKEKNIIAIEENNFTVFNEEIYALSYVRDYAEILGLNPDEITPYFRRTIELQRLKNPEKTSKAEILTQESLIASKLNSAGKNISKNILSIGTFLIIALFIGFLIFEYQRNILHPELVVSFPSKDIKVKTKTIEVLGKTDPENKIFVNGKEIKLNGNGNFKIKISLEKGINKITIKSINAYEKITEVTRYILLE